MVMIGHSQRLAQPLTRGQRRALVLALAVLTGAVLLAVLRSTGAPASRAGCVNVVIASSTGGGIVHECGSAARSLCRAQAHARGAFAADVRAQCRLAGVRSRG